SNHRAEYKPFGEPRRGYRSLRESEGGRRKQRDKRDPRQEKERNRFCKMREAGHHARKIRLRLRNHRTPDRMRDVAMDLPEPNDVRQEHQERDGCRNEKPLVRKLLPRFGQRKACDQQAAKKKGEAELGKEA